MENTHHEPNYMNIFWALTALTVIEVIIPLLDLFPRTTNGMILITLAVIKATMVALYFMHLKYEKSALGWIALTPMVICVFLVFMLMPDITAQNKTYQPPEQAAVSESGASH
jgi:cytochrome c oxidase subunit 4